LIAATPLAATASPNVSLFLDGGTITGGFVAGYNNAMAVDNSHSNLYVVGTVGGVGTIVETPTDGSSAPVVFATSANLNGATPTSITIDSSDDIFVYANDNNIYEFPAGSGPNTNATPYATLPSPLTPTFIAAVGSELYVTRYDNGTVYSVPVTLTTGLPTSSLTTFATGLAAPGVQGISANGNSLLVADDNYPSSGVYKLDTTAGPFTNPAMWIDMSSDPSLAPVDVSVDESGNVFIVDYGNQIFSVDSGSSTYVPYLNPVTDTGNGGTQGICIVGSQIFLSATDTSGGGNESVYSITTYDGSTTPSTTLPTTTVTERDKTLAHTGINSGLLFLAAAIFAISGLVMMREVSRIRRRIK